MVPAPPPARSGTAPPARRRGRPARTDEQRAAHRARLVDAAVAAIRDRGPDVSIEALAAAADVSKPVLYDEFGSRLGIADAIAERMAEDLEREVLARLSDGTPADLDRAIRVVIGALVTFIDREPALYGFLVHAIRNPERGFLENPFVAGMHRQAAMLIGSIAPGMAPGRQRILTDGLFGFVFASVESWQATRAITKDELVDSISGLLETGFRTAAAVAGPAGRIALPSVD